jgi:hypothetical protein
VGAFDLFMRKLLTAMLFVAAAFTPTGMTHAQSSSSSQRGTATHRVAKMPRFEDYPVREVYKGRPARVRLDSLKARMFRTMLREGARTGPNFAGHYTFVLWGCGTGCAQTAVVDARTGRVYFVPVEFSDIIDIEDETARKRVFRLDSKLLVITKSHYDMEHTFTAFYYIFENNRFRLLRKAEEREPEAR